MLAYKVTTKKTPSQPGGLSKVFVQSYTPTIAQIHEWLKKEYGISSGAGTTGYDIEKC